MTKISQNCQFWIDIRKNSKFWVLVHIPWGQWLNSVQFMNTFITQSLVLEADELSSGSVHSNHPSVPELLILGWSNKSSAFGLVEVLTG